MYPHNHATWAPPQTLGLVVKSPGKHKQALSGSTTHKRKTTTVSSISFELHGFGINHAHYVQDPAHSTLRGPKLALHTDVILLVGPKPTKLNPPRSSSTSSVLPSPFLLPAASAEHARKGCRFFACTSTDHSRAKVHVFEIF